MEMNPGRGCSRRMEPSNPPTLRLMPPRRVLGPAFGALAPPAFAVPPDLGPALLLARNGRLKYT
jgi:hypothetical protein